MRAQRAPARLASRSGAGKPPSGRHRRGGQSPPAQPGPARADPLLWGRCGSARGRGAGRSFQPAGSAEKGLSFTAPLSVAFVT